MMENQIAQIMQQMGHLSRPHGHLPEQPETISKIQMNVITLRSDKELEDPLVLIREDRREIEDKANAGKEVLIETSSEWIQIEKPKEVCAESVSPPVKPYKPSVLYP